MDEKEAKKQNTSYRGPQLKSLFMLGKKKELVGRYLNLNSFFVFFIVF